MQKFEISTKQVPSDWRISIDPLNWCIFVQFRYNKVESLDHNSYSSINTCYSINFLLLRIIPVIETFFKTSFKKSKSNNNNDESEIQFNWWEFNVQEVHPIKNY